jgi:diacylglycerol kinase
MTDKPDTEFKKLKARRAKGLGPISLFFHQLSNTSRYSFAGFRYLFKAELAAKIEAVLFTLILVLYFVLGVPLSSYLISTVLFLLLLTSEALNTAIEVIIDHISPEISNVGKRAKDLGSFAVVCTLAANAIFLIWVLVKIICAQ